MEIYQDNPNDWVKKNKDIEELHSGLVALVDELSKRACKAESLLYHARFLAEEDISNGGNKFFSEDLIMSLNDKEAEYKDD